MRAPSEAGEGSLLRGLLVAVVLSLPLWAALVWAVVGVWG